MDINDRLNKLTEKLTDDHILSVGKLHRGVRLGDVPAEYLLWILSEWNHIPSRLYTYLIENQDALMQEQRDGH